MELKNGPVSFLRLIGASFKLANQSFGTACLVFFWVIFFIALFWGILFLSATINPVLSLILQIPFSLFTAFMQSLFPLAIILVLASKAEKMPITSLGAISSSIVPTFLMFISSIILAVPVVLLILAVGYSGSKLAIFVLMIFISFLILPFVFLQPSLVIRRLGPIEALKYSWELGKTFYLKVLGTYVGVGLCFVLLALIPFILIKLFNPAWVENSLFFMKAVQAMSSFQFGSVLSHSSVMLFVVAGVVAIFNYFLFLVISSVTTLLFLNLDYTLNLPANWGNDEMQPLEQENYFVAQEPADTPKNGEELPVKQSAILTDSVDENTFRHLEQVYNPQEHLDTGNPQEEDRMPTILFDDDMLKQLSENEKQMHERSMRAQQQDDDTPDSIKMSDKTL